MVTVTQSSADGSLETPQASTATSVPLTPTPQPTTVLPITSDRCPGISLSFLGEEGNEVRWVLDNQSDQSVNLKDLHDLGWDPLIKGSLHQVRLGEEVLWEGEIGLEDLQGAGTLEMREGANKTIPENQAAFVTLNFQWGNSTENGYALSLELDAGCTLEGVW